MESAVAEVNVSAQSPPCNQNARPAAASAIFALRSSHSPAKTSGGSARRSATAFFICSPSWPPGQLGCWAATSDESKRLSSCEEVEFIVIRVESSVAISQGDYPKNEVISSYRSNGTVLRTSVADANGTRAIFVPWRAIILPKSPS